MSLALSLPAFGGGMTRNKQHLSLRDRWMEFAAWFTAAWSVGTAMAGTVDTNSPFYSFFNAINQYAHGPLGISICIVAVLFGAIVGIGRNQPTAALSGVAFAIFIYFAPTVIVSLFGGVLY